MNRLELSASLRGAAVGEVVTRNMDGYALKGLANLFEKGILTIW